MAAEADVEFVSPLGSKALLVRRLYATERLGRLSEVRLELLRPDHKPQAKAKDILGLHAGVRFKTKDDKWRYVNGICTSFERGGKSQRFDIYRLVLRPWLWQLTLTADCRVFQNQTAMQILDTIFAEYGAGARVEKKTSGSFAKRVYTVQYRETDFDFISRLMEEEGIYYYFSHSHDQHQLVLCNGASGHQPAPVSTLVWGPAQTTNERREDIITHWHRAHVLRSLKYSATDFAAEVPTTDLMASHGRWAATFAKPGNEKKYEIHDYPGGHDDVAMTSVAGKLDAGKRSAKIAVEAFESGHSIASALTPERELAVGSTFTFKDHPEKDQNDGYLVTAAVYALEFGGYEADAGDAGTSYECRFDAVTKKTPFQPERIARPVRMPGPQTATVVGPKGYEIHTDKYGRVKVKFHWDRVGKKDETASAWLRVSQPWASKGFGAIALPRIGDEVVVDFLDGNPDRPLITGRVYNGDNMPPYMLPAQATVAGIRSRSSKGGDDANFNELRFDDKKGSEYVWMQAEKDFRRLVKNDLFDSIGNNSQLDIKKNHVASVGEAYDLTIGKAAQLKIGADTSAEITGDLNLNVKAATNVKLDDLLALKVAQALAMSAGMGLDIDAGMAMKLNAGMDMHVKATLGINVDGGLKISLKAGPSSVVIGPDGVSITGPMVKINSGGAASAATKAKKASPGAAKAPKKVAENKDPLAK